MRNIRFLLTEAERIKKFDWVVFYVFQQVNKPSNTRVLTLTSNICSDIISVHMFDINFDVLTRRGVSDAE